MLRSLVTNDYSVTPNSGYHYLREMISNAKYLEEILTGKSQLQETGYEIYCFI